MLKIVKKPLELKTSLDMKVECRSFRSMSLLMMSKLKISRKTRLEQLLNNKKLYSYQTLRDNIMVQIEIGLLMKSLEELNLKEELWENT